MYTLVIGIAIGVLVIEGLALALRHWRVVAVLLFLLALVGYGITHAPGG